MKAELTAENRPAYSSQTLVMRPTAHRGRRRTHEDEGGVEILVILLRVFSVKLVGFLAIDCEEVGAWIAGPQRLEELFEGGMEAMVGVISALMIIGGDGRTTSSRAGR